MISKDELDRAILEHEAKDTTYANCEKLAWLYIVRDHVCGVGTAQPVPLDVSGESDFLRSVSEKNSVEVFAVMDEVMETLSVVSPNLYRAVMRKLSLIENEGG